MSRDIAIYAKPHRDDARRPDHFPTSAPTRPPPGVKTAAAKSVAAGMSLFHPKTIDDLTAHAIGLLGLLHDDHGDGGSGTQRISEPRRTTATLVGC
jgi:hypothetical protein